MPTIVILGLKLPFKALWSKVGVEERPGCSCPKSVDEFTYCPHCGIRKIVKQIKIYHSLLTGKQTSYRNVESLLHYLHLNNLDIYDTNPRGYTDDPVYIYFTDPRCYMEIRGSEPMVLDTVRKCSNEVEDWLRELLGQELWIRGEYGLWAFNVDQPEREDSPEPPESPPPPSVLPDTKDTPRTILIPIGPRGPFIPPSDDD